MSDSPGPLGDPHDQIAEEILRVHRDSYGTTAGNVVVHIHDDTVFVILDELELSLAENTLLEGGHERTVARMREDFQAAIEATFRAVVERATGQRVTSFLSNTSIPGRYSVEIFRLDVDEAAVSREDPDEQLDAL